MRTLVVRLSALGDIIHTLPTVAALRRAEPEARIDWLVDDRFSELVDLVPIVDRVVVWPRRRARVGALRRVVSELRQQRYDIALDAQGLLKSAVAARLSGAKRVVGFASSHLREPWARWLYTEAVSPGVDPLAHVVTRNLALAKHLEAEVGEWEFPLRPVDSDSVTETRRRLSVGPQDPFVLMNPGTAWESKCWEAARYGELARRLQVAHRFRTAVAWGPGDETRAQEVVAASHGAAVLTPPTSLTDLTALVRIAAIVIAGDTGPLHLAAAVGTPVVGVYGPTDPARNGPWSSDDRVVSRFARCRCRHDRPGARGVVVKTCAHLPRCLDDISVDDVVEAVSARLHPSVHA